MAIVAATFALFPLVAALAPGTPTSAKARALALTRLQGTHVVGAEELLRAWFDRLPPAVSAATEIAYLTLHVTAIVGVGVWLVVRRPSDYRRFRIAFVIAQLMTIATYVLLPTAPPHLASTPGLDAASWSDVVQYRYAAFPSGHVVFACLVAGTAAWWVRGRRLAPLYPTAVALVAIATGHHTVADVVAGALIAAVALVVARRPSRGSRALGPDRVRRRQGHGHGQRRGNGQRRGHAAAPVRDGT